MPRLLLLELNEINFDYLQFYAARGATPNLARLLERHALAETTSELRYEELEPWIQWVTAHTGMPLARHGIFRLGDVVNHDLPQVWEVLEDQGLKVGAVSPMNAKNRCRAPAFFVPDPWTPTPATVPPLLEKLFAAVVQAVNDNARARLTPTSAAWLAVGAARYAHPGNYAQYAALGVAALRKPWARGLILDTLLADVFVAEVRRTKPDFASLFLNAAAHVQHHYMFNSGAYSGTQRNPSWYVSEHLDPVFEVYRAYDRIVGRVVAEFPQARLMIATGLHQDAHDKVTFYWRLCDHAAYLRKIGVRFERIEPRMSRDFLIVCDSREAAARAERLLSSAAALDRTPLFEVDNRGEDLFVTLTYPHDIPAGFLYTIGEQRFANLRSDVAFVGIKNGHHNGIGYFLDSGAPPGGLAARFPLEDLPRHICRALGVEWPAVVGAPERRLLGAL